MAEYCTRGQCAHEAYLEEATLACELGSPVISRERSVRILKFTIQPWTKCSPDGNKHVQQVEMTEEGGRSSRCHTDQKKSTISPVEKHGAASFSLPTCLIAFNSTEAISSGAMYL